MFLTNFKFSQIFIVIFSWHFKRLKILYIFDHVNTINIFDRFNIMNILYCFYTPKSFDYLKIFDIFTI